MQPPFEWDEDKAASNQQKHGATFFEAATAFGDPMAIIIEDPDHSAVEEREIIFGNSDRERLLVVSFTSRPPNLRIISARKANADERRQIENQLARGWNHE